MGVVKDVVNIIKADIDRLETDELGAVVIPEGFLRDFPDPEKYLDPVPDVFERVPEGDIDGWILNDLLSRYPFLLGIYIPMNSPGIVVLFGQNLRCFFWGLIGRICNKGMKPFLTKEDLSRASEMIVLITYHHEVFH